MCVVMHVLSSCLFIGAQISSLPGLVAESQADASRVGASSWRALPPCLARLSLQKGNILPLGSGYVFVTLVLSQTWLGGQKPDLTNGMIHEFHGLPATWCDRMCMKQCLTRGKLCTVAWQTITAPPAVSRCSCRLLGVSLPLRWPAQGSDMIRCQRSD